MGDPRKGDYLCGGTGRQLKLRLMWEPHQREAKGDGGLAGKGNPYLGFDSCSPCKNRRHMLY
eukprot:1157764-Pelagomonas_calceolata.AAC.13